MATVFYDKAMVNVSFDGLNENILASDCTINLSSSQQPTILRLAPRGP